MESYIILTFGFVCGIIVTQLRQDYKAAKMIKAEAYKMNDAYIKGKEEVLEAWDKANKEAYESLSDRGKAEFDEACA